MEKLKYFFILIFFILIKNTFQIETIKFNILEIGNANCISDQSIYRFYLNGIFDLPFDTTEKIFIKLLYPKTTIECSALSKKNYRNDTIKCEVDICEFPMEENILISPEEPTSINNKFEFPNWKDFMNKNPGISNRIEETRIPCFPEINAIFSPTDIISLGCEGDKNIFTITGEWEDKDEVTFKEAKFKIPIINQEEKKAECFFKDLENIICLYQGYGEIKFDKFYFKAISSGYQINGLNKKINVTECINENNTNINGNSNMIKISLILLAFNLFLI